MMTLRPSWAWTPHTIHHTSADDFFEEGNKLCLRQRKQFVVRNSHNDEYLSNENQSDILTFTCQALGCGCVFQSIQQYECHYNSQHRYPCLECRQSFPNSHLLDLHITEWHNPMFEELAHSQNMYQCLLDTCPERFQDYQQRKDHMIQVHKYPANFRFNRPPKQKSQPKKKKKPTHECKDVEAMDTEDAEHGMMSKEDTTLSHKDNTPKSLSSLAFGFLSASKLHSKTALSESSDLSMSCSGSESSVDVDVCDIHSEAHTDKKTTNPSGRRFVYKKSNVPHNICFGAGSQRGFYGRRHPGKKGRHWYQTKNEDKSSTHNIEEVDMEEMAEALDTSS